MSSESYGRTRNDVNYKRDFEESSIIGFGSYGIVSKAKKKNENEFCAIKRIALNDKNKHSLSKEFDIMSQLKSDFVVKVRSIWIENNYLLKDGYEKFKDCEQDSLSDHRLFDHRNDLLLHIQMELCFKSLKELINMIHNELNSYNEEIRTQIHYCILSELFIEILESVNYLHKQNTPIIHRDIKPANILITDGINGRFAKLCDFGLAKLHQFDGQSHTTGVGSLKYMAPEVLREEKYNTKADVYSLGVVFQELIKGMKDQIKAQPEMKCSTKYEKLRDLVELMMKEQELRPNCELVLNQKNVWAMSISDMENDTLVKGIRDNTFCNENNFHSFFLKIKIEIKIASELENDKYNEPLLHMAARQGHLKIVKLLIEKGAKVEAINNLKWTPLHNAASGGHLETVKLLIEKGAKVEAIEFFDRTPLHHAASGGHLETVKFLIEKGAKVDAGDSLKQTPLNLAASGDHLKTVKFLIEKGAKMEVSLFEFDLKNKRKNLKTKFKGDFCNKMEELESEIMVKINDALSHYNEMMYLLLYAIKSEQQFISKHKELKASVINKFKQKCLLKDDDYIDLQISKLEKAINDSCNGFHERLFNDMKKSGSFYENFVNDSFASYAELMEEIFKDNTSISEDELENLHQNIVKDVLSEFEKKFQNEENSLVIESNISALELKIMNEFQSIKETNRRTNVSNEKLDMKLKLEIQDFLKEYEERMEKMFRFCGNETELLEQHLQIKYTITEKMIASNPNLNTIVLESYLIKLEEEINETFNGVKNIFKVNLKKQLLSIQNVIIKARKFYKKEMQKYYIEANFLKMKKLILLNSSVTDHTIAKYQSEKGDMTFENFANAIKDSLKDIYNDFVEENNKNTSTLPAIGIDLGTTNSCVAFYQPSRLSGKTIIVPNDLGNSTTPSVVAFTDNNEEIIGEGAKEQSYRNPRNTIYSAKRLIGRQFDDENVKNDMLLWPFKVVDDGYNIPKISVKVNGSDKVLFPEEISAKLLKKLKQMAENHLGCAVKNAVITVPAYFNEAQKKATKDAGKIAGLNVLKIINDPTAAALAFQLNRSDELGSRKVLIFDFGGGTLDVVILTIENGVIDIKAVGGNNHLGGDDIDAKLVDFCLKDFATKTQIKINRASEEGENALRRLTTECEKKKRQLCAKNSVQIIVDHFYDNEDLTCELNRKKFEELNNDLFVESTDLVVQVLFDAKLEDSDIDDVVLIGGTTRIPKIREMLTDLFYGKSLNHSVNPDEAVAVGAAIQAAILNGTLAQKYRHLRVSDVAPMSLGFKVKDGFMSTIIHRNSKVPNKYTRVYETALNNQTEVDIDIYEGEETMAAANRKLGTFTLSNILPGPAGQQQIEVNFMINDEGILHVNAKITSNGEEKEILITEHKGRLTNAQLQSLIDQEEKNENSTEIRRKYYEEFSEMGLIAIGNYGFVYKALDKKNKKTFAIKKIPIVENLAEKYRKEVNIFSKLKSNFIVGLEFIWIEDNYLKEDDFKDAKNTKINHELFEKNKTLLLHIQMELCSMTLREAIVILNQKLGQQFSEVMSPLGYYLSSELFIEVLEGINYLHKNDVIHRDLKPSNILITDGKNGNFIKVADFGSATIHEFDGQSHTKYKGAIGYAAPEVMRSRSYDTKADIYSLGVIAQQMFNININEPIGKTSVLEKKYSAIFDVIIRMLSLLIASRPNCETILSERSLWALRLHELSNADKIKYKTRNHFETFKTCVLSSLLSYEEPKEGEISVSYNIDLTHPTYDSESNSDESFIFLDTDEDDRYSNK